MGWKEYDCRCLEFSETGKPLVGPEQKYEQIEFACYTNYSHYLLKKVICEVAIVKDGSCYHDSGEGWWWLAELLVVNLSKVVIFLVYI